MQLPLKVSLHILHTTSHISGLERAADSGVLTLWSADASSALQLHQLELLVVLVLGLELGDDLVLREEPPVHQVLEALRILAG